MRRTAAVTLAALGLAGAGCDSGDEGSGGAPDKVTTTRVRVIESIGREGDFDPGQIYQRFAPGVVTVISMFRGGLLDTEGGEGGQGSGFVLDGGGYVATNAHVVTTSAGADDGKRAEKVFVEFSDGNRVPAEIVGAGARGDDVSVSGHVAPAVEHEARALTPLAALGVEQSAIEHRDHGDHARGEALIDLPRVKVAFATDALDDPDPRGGHLVRSAAAPLVA